MKLGLGGGRTGGPSKNALILIRFQHGPPPGPAILMQLLRKELTPEEAATKFEANVTDAKDKKKGKATEKRLYQCSACNKELPTISFGCRRPCEVFSGVIEAGYWRQCKSCSLTARLKTARKNYRMEMRMCTKCGLKPSYEFDFQYTKYDRETRTCRECAQLHPEADLPKCAICRKNFPKEELRTYQGGPFNENDKSRYCEQCLHKRQKNELLCTACKTVRPRSEFPPEQLLPARKSRRKCFRHFD